MQLLRVLIQRAQYRILHEVLCDRTAETRRNRQRFGLRQQRQRHTPVAVHIPLYYFYG